MNYGAANIAASIARLDEVGVLHTGAGPNLAAARAPAIVERNGLRVGVLQRSSVYWPTDHEARDDSPGIAVLRGHTAYQVPQGRLHAGIPPANRPGVPPEIITWADPAYVAEFRKDIEALRPQVDILVASCHWGLGREPMQYMTEIGHAAIDAGADIVMGHGPHYSLPVEVYKGRPIYYGLGNLCFKTGHGGRKHADWIGMLVEVTFENGKSAPTTFASCATTGYETISAGRRTRRRRLATSRRAARRSAPHSSPRAIGSALRREARRFHSVTQINRDKTRPGHVLMNTLECLCFWG